MKNYTPKNGFDKNPQNINRKGRPPRGWTWADVFEKEVEKQSIKDKKTIKQVMVKAMIDKVVKYKDVSAFKEIANRMDGMPKQAVEAKITGELSLMEVLGAVDRKPTGTKPTDTKAGG